MRRALSLGLASVLLAGASAAPQTGEAAPQTGEAAPQVRVQLSAPPHFVNEPIEVQLVAQGFAREPDPDVSIESPGARLELLGMSPNVSSSITIIGGRVTRTETVRFVYRYQLVAARPGRYRVGPFRVAQGQLAASAAALTLDVSAVPASDRLRIRLVLPETPIYPGQRVPIGIEWSIAAELRERLHRYRIRSPLFDRSDVFRFLDAETAPGSAELTLETAAGQVSLPAEIRTERIGEVEFFVVTAERTLVPLTPGTFDVGAASVVVDVITHWRRDFFAGRVPERVRKQRAEDLPRRLVVREIPTQGRPPGFAGAVGRGFTLEVSADRSVVQVGDPIQLTFVLRGDGNLESAGLPESIAAMGLSAQEFRLPSGEVDGAVAEGAKTFSIAVRALAESVSEIPPLRYAYFDPEAGKFMAARSRPIALSVRPASLVTAQDVVTADPAGAAQLGAQATPLPPPGQAAAALTLVGANLSIVREPELLLGASRAALGSPFVIALYAASLVLVGLAMAWRRRADVEPEALERRKALRRERGRIARAAGLPPSRALGTIAEALRAMVRQSVGPRPEQLDQFLAECDAVIFAPGGGGEEPLDPAFQRRALELADALLEGAP